MREPKNQMLGTMEPPLMQLSVKKGQNKSKWNRRVYKIWELTTALKDAKNLH